MTAAPKLPITLLVGLSTTLRDAVLQPSLDAETVAVVVDQDELAARGVLTWRVLDRTGRVDSGEFEVGDDCGACQLIESLLPLVQVIVERGTWQHIVLATPPAMEARPLAGTLVAVLPDAVTVDTITCVVDAVLLVEQLTGDELLEERGLALGPPDRRNVAELTARQVEYADICVLANTHRSRSTEQLRQLLRHLNPRTVVVEADPAGVPAEPVTRRGQFDFAAAEAWADDCTAGDGLQLSGAGVTTILWHSTRPMHPARLSEALEDIVEGVVRSRGVVWLANRPSQRIRWESAGYSASLGSLGEWTDGGHLAECTLIATGVGLDPARLQTVLDACLLTQAELATLDWQSLEDPFAGVF
jgi:G3E family GTPase